MSTRMGKRRKTKQAKIISQLKRELAQQAAAGHPVKPESRPSQEAKIFEPKPELFEAKEEKRSALKLHSEEYSFLKRDLVKTLAISAAILSLEIVLYLRLG